MQDPGKRPWAKRLPVPFGLNATKPRHFRDMAQVAWQNRDQLPYAWKVLSQGVCDGCALGVSGFHDWTIDGVHLCMTRLNLLRLNTMPAFDPTVVSEIARLRAKTNSELRDLGRIPVPLLRRRGERGFRPVSWPEAYTLLGTRIRTMDSRRLAFFLTSRGLTNEVYYVAQKVARFLGTNHIDNAARLCHSPSTGAMKFALGVGASTCSYRDWFGTDLIVFFGSNPANDQPVATKYLHEAKRLGTQVALVNPYREPGMVKYWVPSNVRSAVWGTDILDMWYPVAQGGDLYFLAGVLKLLIANGGWDKEFVQNHTEGFNDLVASLEAIPLEFLQQQAGVDAELMHDFARRLQCARRAVFVWSMGLTQHAHGGDTISMLLNLGLACGYVGREKCGLMPIRGHSGVQGGAEMGAYSTAFPGGTAITPETAASLSAQYGFPVPDWPGFTAPEMVEACGQGRLDLLYCAGGNFLRTLPDPESVEQSLSQVPWRVHQDLILTDQALLDAGEGVLLLPAKTRYEQEGGGTETTTERRILFSPEIPRQVGEARSEWRIFRELACAVDPERAPLLGCEDAVAIREEIARVVPMYDGIQRLCRSGDAFQYGGERLFEDKVFATPTGKARFRTVPFPARNGRSPRLEGSATGPARSPVFQLSTRRGKQFNTLIYAEVDPLTGAARDAVFMHPSDAEGLGLREGDAVVVMNDVGRFTGRVFLAAITPGNLQVHWPEGNVLIPRGVVEPTGGVPDYNAQVQVQRLAK